MYRVGTVFKNEIDNIEKVESQVVESKRQICSGMGLLPV